MDSATDPYFSAQPAGMDLDGGMAPAPLSFTEVKPYPACPLSNSLHLFPPSPPRPPSPLMGRRGFAGVIRRLEPAAGASHAPPPKLAPIDPAQKSGRFLVLGTNSASPASVSSLPEHHGWTFGTLQIVEGLC
jgi:hypothetical protein